MEYASTLIDKGSQPKPSPPKGLTNTSQSQNLSVLVGETIIPMKCTTSRPFRVSVEGNIGAGKSTLIDYFAKIPGIETFPEPIAWWRNLHGHNLLELLYSDIEKWNSVFQTYVQLTRLQIQTTPPKSPDTRVQMFERSLQNNRYCFAEQAYKAGFLHPAEYGILDQWFLWIQENVDIEIDLIVYLRSTPEVVYERMKARGRPEESPVTFEYLKELHESHERWLMSGDAAFKNGPVLVLDADKPLNEIIEEYEANKDKILGQRSNGEESNSSSEKEN